MSDVVVTETLSETVERQAKEIERLRLRAEDDAKRLAWHDETLAERDAEIERLRDLLAEALDSEISDYWYVRVGEALGR